MAVNVKMGVDIGGFTSGIREGQQILKGLNAEMKASDAAFKATGNAEQKLNSQTKTLNSTLNVQKGIADQARQALDAMTKAGVDPASAAYQKMYVTLMNAEAGANEAQAALNNLGAGAAQAADGAEQLTKGLNGISKKISLEQVISGIDKITTGLANAAKKAVQLGEDIWNSIMDSAAYGDDISTMATRMGLTNDEVQRMIYVADRFEAPAEQMAKTWKKLKMNMTSDSKDVAAAFDRLGVSTREWGEAGQSGPALVAKNYKDVFWEVGDALMHVSDASEQERMAQTLLGRSWDEMIPLFKAGRKAYEEALEAAPTATEEATEAAASLNDRVKELEKSWDTLKLEVVGAIAPALEKGADAIGKVLDSLTEYLQTEEGKELLSELGTAVSDLFSGLGDISTEDIVSNFSSLLSSMTEGLNWIKDNGNLVAGIIGTLGTAFAGLTITGNVLTFLKLIQGIKDFKIFGNSGAPGNDGGVSTVAGSAGPTFWDKIAQHTNGFFLNNGAAVMDWMTHEGPLGTVFQGVETLNDWFDRMKREQQERTENFADNWNPYGEDANVIAKGIGNANKGFAGWVAGILDSLTGQPVKVEPEVEEGAANSIAEQVGTVEINGVLHMVDAEGNDIGDLGDWTGEYVGGHGKRRKKKANGIWSVPYDGYLAELHRGERVVPAREVQSRSYNSNLYVESMIMNNGTDAAGLAAAMAAAQRRTMSGYGS